MVSSANSQSSSSSVDSHRKSMHQQAFKNSGNPIQIYEELEDEPYLGSAFKPKKHVRVVEIEMESQTLAT